MSSLVRRLVIFATIDGLILHATSDQHKSLLIEYGSQKFSETSKSSHSHTSHSPRIEAFGLIGFVNIASYSFLIAITKRQEVARIFDKPVYLVTDVTLLPLTSQVEATTAIKDAAQSMEVGSDESDSASSDDEGEEKSRPSSDTLAATPGDDVGPFQGKNSSSTSIAEDVATRTVSFGRFASQWFSKQKVLPTSAPSRPSDHSELKPASKDDPIAQDIVNAEEQKEAASKMKTSFAPTKPAATLALLPRILRTTKMVFTSGSYFFSYDIDLTRRLQQPGVLEQPLSFRNLHPMFFWNRNLGTPLLESKFAHFLTPVMQGFVGQRAFTISKPEGSDSPQAEVKAVTPDVKALAETSDSKSSEQSFLLTVISRRSIKRSGLRYLRRGIDDEGFTANFVETEQLLSAADWSPSFSLRSFVQVRGSIPLYFSQSPYSFKPAAVFYNSPAMNEKAYNKHFDMLKKEYGAIQLAVLVDRHGTEKPIGEAYERLYEKSKQENKADNVSFEWFDFHAECRGMKFENVSLLIDKLGDFLTSSGETVIRDDKTVKTQTGVIRTNCMDCLDRTNVAQSAFAQQKLQKSLEEEGFAIDFVKDPSTNWFNILWADNGDAISRLYASTAALKGDFTRTRKRNWRGAMNDFGLTLSRYYSNMVNDYFSQTVLDLLLGNVSWKVFEDFESTMMSVDPGISVRSGREAAIETCSKMVISEPDKEDVIHAWTMLVPNQENTLRTLPLEEAVVLLTDAAIYCCKMDWTTEKLAKYEKIDLRSIRSIKVGAYVTSTFTEKQMDERFNQGLAIYYTPGKGDLVRVNTRSLQNYHIPEERQGVDGGTGILSWVASSVSKPASQERLMGLKVLPCGEEDVVENAKTGGPQSIADSIADEIRRAISGSTEHGEQRGKELIEHSDVISVAEAKKRTGYLEQVSHSIKKLVWA